MQKLTVEFNIWKRTLKGVAILSLSLCATLAAAEKKTAPKKSENKKSPPEKLAPPSTPPTKTVHHGFNKGENLDISFFIVEHVEAAGNSHRFSANKVEASDSATVQGFSMLMSTIMPEQEIGDISGVFQIGNELWEFGTRSVAMLNTGRLIVNTRVSVKDQGTGSTELIEKEPYNSVKVMGNKEQNVTEFIDVGVKIEAAPKILENGNVFAKTKMSISEVLRENDNSRKTRVPVVSFRTVNTTLEFQPGRLELLSELTIQKSLDTESGIPYLRKIPLLGKLLFAHTSRRVVNTKLYIVGGISPPEREKIAEYKALRDRIQEEDKNKINKYR